MSTLPIKQYSNEATNLREPDGEPQGIEVADVVPLRPVEDMTNIKGQLGQYRNEKQSIQGTSSDRKNITPLRKSK